MSANPAEVREWLENAARNLLSARILLEHNPPVPDTAAFHCQQAVEKALKAFLVARAVPFQRVHNLTYLMDLCEQEDVGLASLRDRAEALTPYAVEVRYPGLVIVSPEEATDALRTAEDVFAAVLALIPAECHPASANGEHPPS